MSYRIAICFAAAAIGISCIATDASARGRGDGAPPASANKSMSPGGKVTTIPSTVGAGGPTGGGAAKGARYYAPATYDANAACGRYPYPPCKKVPRQ